MRIHEQRAIPESLSYINKDPEQQSSSTTSTVPEVQPVAAGPGGELSSDPFR
jgi:hypothetical protein